MPSYWFEASWSAVRIIFNLYRVIKIRAEERKHPVLKKRSAAPALRHLIRTLLVGKNGVWQGSSICVGNQKPVVAKVYYRQFLVRGFSQRVGLTKTSNKVPTLNNTWNQWAYKNNERLNVNSGGSATVMRRAIISIVKRMHVLRARRGLSTRLTQVSHS